MCGICHLLLQLILHKGAKAIQWGNNSFSQQMVLGNLDILMQKDDFSTYLILYKFLNLKWIILQNLISKTRKLLEENIQENLCALTFWDTVPKAQTIFQKETNWSSSKQIITIICAPQKTSFKKIKIGENICKSYFS